MALASPRPSGRIVFVQPEREFLLQKAGLLGLGSSFVAVGAAFFAGFTSPPTVPWVAVPFLLLGTPFLYLGARAKPYRLLEDGIELPSGRLIGYDRVRDVQHLDSRRGRAKFLVLAFTDGAFAVIGSGFTKNVIFSTRRFEAVESLVVRGVEERGPKPDLEWEDDLWARVAALEFRGPVIVNAEKAAREQGVGRIDQEFLNHAALGDKRLRWWLAAAASATSRPTRHPNRNSTP